MNNGQPCRDHFLELRALRAKGDPAAIKRNPLIVPSRDEALAGPDIECLESAEIWIRPPAEFVLDLSGTNLDHSLCEAQPHQRHGSYRSRFTDVLVFGYHHFHGVLSKDCRIASQEIDGMRERLDTHILHHPGRETAIPQIYQTEQGYEVDFQGMEYEELEGSLYFGTPIEPLNWGMWLLQAIPAAVDFLSSGLAERFFAYIGRDWQRRLLNAIGIPDDKLLHQELGSTYRCSDLIWRQFSNIDLVPSPAEKEVFAKVARDVAGLKNVTPGRRLFLSRRSITRESEGRYRALLNEDALVSACAARKYEIVEPELLSFPEQIRTFAEADLIVGLGGAAFFNSIFSSPATRVVSIESSTAFAHAHACLFGAMGHPFAFIFGKQDLDDDTPVQKRWTIDVEEVIAALERYESE